MLENAWTYSPSDALAYYNVDAKTGLSADAVEKNRELYGENSELQ
jgi:Ca2+ transporting ATPase